MSEYVAYDSNCDLLLASVPSLAVQPLCARAELAEVGEDIFALGSPIGLRQTVTRGIVSAIRSSSELGRYGTKNFRGLEVIQVDAAICPGSSGGPIVDQNLSVVGISTFMIGPQGGMNFGVPVNEALRLRSLIMPRRPLAELRDEAQGDASGSKPVAVNEARAIITAIGVGIMMMDGSLDRAEAAVLTEALKQFDVSRADYEAGVAHWEGTRRGDVKSQLIQLTALGLSLRSAMSQLDRMNFWMRLHDLAAIGGLDLREMTALHMLSDALGLDSLLKALK